MKPGQYASLTPVLCELDRRHAEGWRFILNQHDNKARGQTFGDAKTGNYHCGAVHKSVPEQTTFAPVDGSPRELMARYNIHEDGDSLLEAVVAVLARITALTTPVPPP